MSMPSGRKRRDFCSLAAVTQISWLKLCFHHLTDCQHRTIICLLAWLSFLFSPLRKKPQINKRKTGEGKGCTGKNSMGRIQLIWSHHLRHLKMYQRHKWVPSLPPLLPPPLPMLAGECSQVFGTENVPVFVCLKSCTNMDIRVLVYLGWCVQQL